MSYLSDLLQSLLTGLQFVLDVVAGYARKHPMATALAVLALLRLFGTTVQTGSRGVLFVCGRVRKELEPGFHPLLPVVLAVRKIPVRSVTLDLPRQRLTTADGLVYDVQANIVYRVADPILALTHIDNLRRGIEVLLPLIVEDLLREQTRVAVLNFKALEAELIARAEEKLRRWGVTVEQAGFKSIAPTKRTLRLTQLAGLGDERAAVLGELVGRGVPVHAAVALLGADRRLVSHAAARYHALHHLARPAPATVAAPHPPRPLSGEEPVVAEPTAPTEEEPTPEAPIAELVQPTTETPTPAPPRPRKTSKGVQPRSWLRLQQRLRLPRGGAVAAGPATLVADSSHQ